MDACILSGTSCTTNEAASKQARGVQSSWRTAICTAKRAASEHGSCETCSFQGAVVLLGRRWVEQLSTTQFQALMIMHLSAVVMQRAASRSLPKSLKNSQAEHTFRGWRHEIRDSFAGLHPSCGATVTL